MTTRMSGIINILARADDYVTGIELATKLGVTARTIREDIKTINKKIINYDTKIISKKSKGYKITSKSKEQITTLVNLIKAESLSLNSNSITPDDRERYIIKRLLFANNEIKLYSLTQELYVSESTVKNDLIEVKGILNKYNIRITSNYKGIRAE